MILDLLTGVAAGWTAAALCDRGWAAAAVGAVVIVCLLAARVSA